jgi:2,4-dienoyl-CoA reductase-like NADH-dependent reductase (Old Yellow Enzyme family)
MGEGEWGLFDDKHIDGYRRVAQAVHQDDALLIVQIFHAGMRADDKLIEGPARSCVDTD